VRCPKCGSARNVGKITTWDMENSRTVRAYYCARCLVEFLADGTIIPLLDETNERERKKTKKEKVFELFDKGITDKKEVIKKTKIAEGTYRHYSYLYKKGVR
jgi:hypothetical protein